MSDPRIMDIFDDLKDDEFDAAFNVATADEKRMFKENPWLKQKNHPGAVSPWKNEGSLTRVIPGETPMFNDRTRRNVYDTLWLNSPSSLDKTKIVEKENYREILDEEVFLEVIWESNDGKLTQGAIANYNTNYFLFFNDEEKEVKLILIEQVIVYKKMTPENKQRCAEWFQTSEHWKGN